MSGFSESDRAKAAQALGAGAYVRKPYVIESIRTSTWETAELGRLECRKNFAFNAEWNGKYYSTRQIRPIFVEEPDEIVVVTIYVYYF